ncbi:hypothetical protein NCZ17_02065 [Acinetobacter modestus]|uniref:hypothetical protein n=1 Tax=Acinetobacter modestus TaxID=1776740 RepID=UPI00202E0BC8|nr:hypothetical protein [Acinetobacter modestus]MCM1958157.1 hypothetical protein [Acinetobacter modestus]
MNAIDFIKQHGVTQAKKCLSICASPNDKWFIHEGDLISDSDFGDLKRLVESIDYLNEWYEGKIDDAYDHVERMYGMLKLRPQFPNLHARIQLVEGHLANYKAIYSEKGC